MLITGNYSLSPHVIYCDNFHKSRKIFLGTYHTGSSLVFISIALICNINFERDKKRSLSKFAQQCFFSHPEGFWSIQENNGPFQHLSLSHTLFSFLPTSAEYITGWENWAMRACVRAREKEKIPGPDKSSRYILFLLLLLLSSQRERKSLFISLRFFSLLHFLPFVLFFLPRLH